MQTGRVIRREQASPAQEPLHAASEDVSDGGIGTDSAVRVARILSAAAAMAVLATGVLVLFGWLLDIPSLKSVLPGVVTIPAGTNVIGALVANQSVNLAQVNGVTVLTGAGAVGTGSARVAVGQDTSTIAGSAPGTA